MQYKISVDLSDEATCALEIVH